MYFTSALVSAFAGLWLAGCASVSAERGVAAVNEQLRTRGAPAADFGASARADVPAGTSLGVDQAVQLAFERSPAVRELYAEIGVSTADLVAARRPPNPTLGYARLSGGGAEQITRSVSFGFADLLLLPSRTRLANAGYENTRDRVAARLLALESDVRTAWYEAAAAAQEADVAALAARAAQASADYARRLDAAGNITPRSLALELASAADGDIAAARARAAAVRARAHLATLIGLSTRDDWRIPARLPAPPEADALPAESVDHALQMRLDLAAAKREAAAFDGVLGAARAWRWLGDLEVGYERETETDGARLRGLTFAFTLPLFGFNRDGVMRAEAARDAAHARATSLELAVRNEVALAQDRMATARDVAQIYRTALVPQREAATAHTLEEVNYMLSGAFELLATRREQFAAYREYVGAVRDYWVARVDVERALGAHLAGDAATPATLELGLTGASE
jgi:cobalt-zinc-cadmium efflux system outer membrane protein